MNELFEDDERPILKIGDYGFDKFQKPQPKTRGISSERQGILKDILDIINLERLEDKEWKYRLLLPRGLAIKLSHIPTQDLYFMKSEGMDYKRRGKGGFGKYIFGSIKKI